MPREKLPTGGNGLRPPVTGAGNANPARKLPDHADNSADPDGVAPAADAADDEPKGQPNSDRHKMETLIGKLPTGG